MTRVAAFDCGTNSLRLLIADLDVEAGTSEDLVREMRIVRLGQGVDRTGRIADASLQRVFGAVEDYMEQVKEHDVRRSGSARPRLLATPRTPTSSSPASGSASGSTPRCSTGTRRRG